MKINGFIELGSSYLYYGKEVGSSTVFWYVYHCNFIGDGFIIDGECLQYEISHKKYLTIALTEYDKRNYYQIISQ